jgi:hypothetical protein
MFNELNNTLAQAFLGGLLILWALLLFGGFFLGRPDEKKISRMPTWTRLISSLTLVVAAWVWYVVTRDGSLSSFSLWIALGMTLGWIGDLCMAKIFPLPEPVLGGMAAFGLGHIFYIIAFLGFGNQSGLDATLPRLSGWVFWLLAGLVCWYFVVFRPGSPGIMRWAALPYALLLSSTVGVATGLALQDPVFWPVAAGAALFLLSDLIIAAQVFNNLYFSFIGDVIWLTYGPAQALIVYGGLNGALQFVAGS